MRAYQDPTSGEGGASRSEARTGRDARPGAAAAEAPPRRDRDAPSEDATRKTAAKPAPDDRPDGPPADGRRRVVIEGVSPEIDAGRFAVKRVAGEEVAVEADVFTDGHDRVAGVVRYRGGDDSAWRETPLEFVDNDRWRAVFTVAEVGTYRYTLEAWVDRFRTWQEDLAKRVAAGQDVRVELEIGAVLVDGATDRAKAVGNDADAERLRKWSDLIRGSSGAEGDGRDRGRRSGRARTSGTSAAAGSADAVAGDVVVESALADELAALMARHPDRDSATIYERELEVVVDRPRARFSSWYEMFPRSAAAEPGRHGTFRDVEARLPYVADLGFDVLYLPPIHPIGRTKRKGKNNAGVAEPGDVGSPWAIGAEEGGHKSIHPELGTPEDFRRLIERAHEHGIEIALDIAFQCAPDHPWVHEHPEWFRWRPDGSVQYAENPPKKYEDIYPLDFETAAWRELWQELKSVFLHWIGQGVLTFRVDNPHTKPFAFWEWCIGEIKREHPDVIFLSEAFTRPKVMYRLAKLGFTQSYTYFAWRNHAWDLREYFTELTRTEVREFFRPNAWPNTPDILTEYIQNGGRGAFMARLTLAATLAASYGIYGPAFELMEHLPRQPGGEEYLHSEKYQVRSWELDRPDSLAPFIARVNRIRRHNAALQTDRGLRFHGAENNQLLVYSKRTPERSNVVLVVVNLDPYHTQSGWVDLDLGELGVQPDEPFQVHDLLTDARFLWKGSHNFVELNPHASPAHVFRVIRRVRTEQDFEYFM